MALSRAAVRYGGRNRFHLLERDELSQKVIDKDLIRRRRHEL